MDIEIPEKLLPLFETKKRYIVLYGGRGSAKSWTVADFLLSKGREKKNASCAQEKCKIQYAILFINFFLIK
jgi:phage terminase large subunit